MVAARPSRCGDFFQQGGLRRENGVLLSAGSLLRWRARDVRLKRSFPRGEQEQGMPSSGDVTHWLRLLQAGDREAVQKLWEGYYRRLVGLARKKLGELPRRA